MQRRYAILYGGCSDLGAAHVLPGASMLPWARAQSVVADPLSKGNEIRFEYAAEEGQHLLQHARFGFKGVAGERPSS